jgi:hypothetical protein
MKIAIQVFYPICFFNFFIFPIELIYNLAKFEGI